MSVLHRKPKRQPWFEFSRGQYYLKSGEAINMYLPVQYSGGVASRTYAGVSRHGKIEILQYADATGVEACPGVVWESVISDTAAIAQISAGLNVARELALMRKGFIYMVYNEGVGSTTTPYYGMRIAPHPDGFQQWKTGMFCLGKFAGESNTNGVDFSTPEHQSLRVFRVEIDVAQSEVSEANTLAEMTDTTITSVASGESLVHNGTAFVNAAFKTMKTASLASHVHTFAGDTIITAISVINLDATGNTALVPSAAAPNEGEYQLTDTNTTITTNATDDIAEVVVTYLYDANA